MEIKSKSRLWRTLRERTKAMTEDTFFNSAKSAYLTSDAYQRDASNPASFAVDLPVVYFLDKGGSLAAWVSTYNRICHRCNEVDLRIPGNDYRVWFADAIPDESQCQNCLSTFTRSNVINPLIDKMRPPIYSHQSHRSFIYIHEIDLLGGYIEGTVLNPVYEVSLNADTQEEILQKIRTNNTSSLIPLKKNIDYSHRYGVVGFFIQVHGNGEVSWSVYDRYSDEFIADITSVPQRMIENLGYSTILLDYNDIKADLLKKYTKRFFGDAFSHKIQSSTWNKINEKKHQENSLDILFNNLKDIR